MLYNAYVRRAWWVNVYRRQASIGYLFTTTDTRKTSHKGHAILVTFVKVFWPPSLALLFDLAGEQNEPKHVERPDDLCTNQLDQIDAHLHYTDLLLTMTMASQKCLQGMPTGCIFPVAKAHSVHSP